MDWDDENVGSGGLCYLNVGVVKFNKFRINWEVSFIILGGFLVFDFNFSK